MARDLTNIHPDLHSVIQKFPRFPINRWTVGLMRLLQGVMPLPKPPDDVLIREESAPREASSRPVRVWVYKPRDLTTPAPALLWIHGGGLVIGNAQMNDRQLATFVQALGIVVVSVEYRLAPTHPYPAAIDDCYTALKWLHDRAAALGVDPARVAVGGASAGGGLAAALAQMAHDRGEVGIAFQLLAYPMLDDRSALCADVAHPDTLTWTPQQNRFGWESYLRQPAGQAETLPYAVPGRREDLTGLPPAWIGVGSLDLFYEENVAYADRLRRCGVACELVVVDGAFHGFDAFMDDVPVCRDFLDEQIEGLRRYLVGE
ncbi:MAG: alpha/beta hydrolase [Anaerolineae bacterium]|nr:alpha/beta hydrolase [Anaerolineae bacterium]